MKCPVHARQDLDFLYLYDPNSDLRGGYLALQDYRWCPKCQKIYRYTESVEELQIV